MSTESVESKTIIFSQPYEIKAEVIEKMNSKLEIVPEIKVSITRKLEDGESIEKVIESDINIVVEKAKNALQRLKEL